MNFSNQIKQYIFIITLILFIELVKFSLTSDKTPLLGGGGNNHARGNPHIPFRLRSSNGGSGGLRSYAGNHVGGRWRLRNNGKSKHGQNRNFRHPFSG